MCRMFAYISPEVSTAESELGAPGVAAFNSLARLHRDGWGWAGVSHLGAEPRIIKSASSAADDPAFRSALSQSARAAMVHLRWATPGFVSKTRNAHPFQSKNICFAHNGYLAPVDRLKEMIPSDLTKKLIGETDSEMYFALILEQIETGKTLAAAVQQVAVRLRIAFPNASLNAILLNGDELVVVHANFNSELTDEAQATFAEFPELPEVHNSCYYQLGWQRKADGTTIFASTGILTTGWTFLPTESITTIRLSDNRIQTVSI